MPLVFYKTPRSTKIILIFQMIGLLMGTSTHLFWVLKNGFLSIHYNAPLFSKIFWDALTFLDPLAAILLFLKPKLGVYLTLIIIVFDIIHNNLIYFDELYLNAPPLKEWIIKYWMILGQILFGVFVISTLRWNIKTITNSTKH